MTEPTRERWRAAAATLREQERLMLARFPPSAKPRTPTWYHFFAADLERDGPPDPRGDHLKLTTTAIALISLPQRADFADLIVWLFGLLRAHPMGQGALPPMLLASLDQYLSPADRWALGPLLEAAAGGAGGAGVRQDAFLQQMGGAGALAALALVARRDDTQAVDLLMAALQGGDQRRALLAGTALAELRVAAAAGPLAELLRQTRDDRAVRALGLLGQPEALKPLLDALRESQRYGRPSFSALAEALGRLGDARAVEALEPHLRRSNLALSAAMALLRLGDRRGLAVVERAAESDFEAARVLAAVGRPQGLPALQSQYSALDTLDRGSLVRDLSRHGTADDIPLLEWVAGTDFGQLDQGWPLAEEAERAIVRIRARAERDRS
jgi:hypothetical protein